MEPKYKTLADLINAIHKGEKITLFLDNDNVSAWSNDEDPAKDELLFEMHPQELLEATLGLLQIPWDYV